MIRTHNVLGIEIAITFEQLCAAMSTQVVKSAKPTFTVTQSHEWIVAHIQSDVVARVWQVGLDTCQRPLTAEQVLVFAGKPTVAQIRLAGQPLTRRLGHCGTRAGGSFH
tara:strand:- start:77 stop:403 length:327 start_codon:yes stop_codon:yes gene_type:complete